MLLMPRRPASALSSCGQLAWTDGRVPTSFGSAAIPPCGLQVADDVARHVPRRVPRLGGCWWKATTSRRSSAARLRRIEGRRYDMTHDESVWCVVRPTAASPRPISSRERARPNPDRDPGSGGPRPESGRRHAALRLTESCVGNTVDPRCSSYRHVSCPQVGVDSSTGSGEPPTPFPPVVHSRVHRRWPWAGARGAESVTGGR
jgi:hypothetical protein